MELKHNMDYQLLAWWYLYHTKWKLSNDMDVRYCIMCNSCSRQLLDT